MKIYQKSFGGSFLLVCAVFKREMGEGLTELEKENAVRHLVTEALMETLLLSEQWREETAPQVFQICKGMTPEKFVVLMSMEPTKEEHEAEQAQSLNEADLDH